MRDTELYRHLLGLGAPWEVGRVELSVADGRVDVWVEHPGRTRSPVRTAMHRCRSMTTRSSGRGGIWTRARS